VYALCIAVGQRTMNRATSFPFVLKENSTSQELASKQ
jgi:hypothetical protein